LVFLLIQRLLTLAVREEAGAPSSGAQSGFAAAGALLWAVHPLRVETVTWASALLHSQAICFLLLATLAYCRATGSVTPARRRGWYWLSVLAYLASLFSYPIGLGFVVALLALDVYPRRRWGASGRARLLLEKLPFAVAAGLCVGITLWARLNVRGGWIEAAPLAEFGLAHRLMQAAYIWAYYVWKPWWPVGLAPVYTTLLDFQPTDPVLVQSLVFLGILTVIIIAQRRVWPAVLPLWVTYLALMVPVLGLTEHPHYANDRYGNLAGILWSIALAAAALKWCRAPRRRAVALAGAGVVAVGLALLSFQQVGIWRNSTTLFEHILARLGNHPYRFDAHWRLGRVLTDQGQLEPAMAHHLAALNIAPNFAEAHFSLGVTLELLGQTDEAFQRYATALRLKSDYAEAHLRLGLLLAARGRRTEALEHLRHALRVDPGLAEARRTLAEWEAQRTQ
jgi:hypothetical protein